MKILIIGGGAAGFFAAINIAEKNPTYEVTILEKSNKLLSKVKVSGGGRCNVTNARSTPSELVNYYPRGHKKLHSLFKAFSTNNMVDWLAKRGVQTKTESDLRMFPRSDSSQTIIDCFQTAAKKNNVKVLTNKAMNSFYKKGGKWIIETSNGEHEVDKFIIATGSSPALWKSLEKFGFEIEPPVPSLFTFNISDERIKGLQGLSFDSAAVKITGTKLEDIGPLLITHWGLSGPAVLKLSAWGAQELNKVNYQFSILVNYLGELNSKAAMNLLKKYSETNPKRKVSNYPLFDLPKRFWTQLLDFCSISAETTFADLSKRQQNKLIEELTQGLYKVKGKSTFKEEFVTCGGVKLSEIDLNTFESKRFKNLYLAGEVLNIDALTGGFNFQACWSAAWVISESIKQQERY
ncbi:MAG: NAD(P)/FAD-dependent oxidoreductase [Cyclobacteriaceae bacterium]